MTMQELFAHQASHGDRSPWEKHSVTKVSTSSPHYSLLFVAGLLRWMGAGVPIVKEAEIHKLRAVFRLDVRWETILGDLLEME
jgi:hypothetical protein